MQLVVVRELLVVAAVAVVDNFVGVEWAIVVVNECVIVVRVDFAGITNLVVRFGSDFDYVVVLPMDLVSTAQLVAAVR